MNASSSTEPRAPVRAEVLRESEQLDPRDAVALDERSSIDGLLALLVTDLEGFTALVQRLGDRDACSVMGAHNRLLRECLRANRGREVTHTGDGVIAAFRSVSAALETASEVQRSFAAHTRANPRAPLRARIGVHVGEPLPYDGRLFGTCVNTAVRVCAAAPAECVLVTDLAWQCAAGSAFRFADHSQVALKGLREPMQLHELLWHPQVGPPPHVSRSAPS